MPEDAIDEGDYEWKERCRVMGEKAYPPKRYYDVYSYSTDSSDYTRGHLGDATGEVISSSSLAWNSTNADFVYSD